MKALLLFLVLSSSLYAHPKIGHLTKPMLESLEMGYFAYYNPHEKTLFHHGKLFHLVTGAHGHLSERPLISIGSIPSAREVISLDPANSSMLEAKYQELLAYLHSSARSLEELLAMTSSFVRHEAFLPHLCGEKEVNTFVQNWVFQQNRARADFTLTLEAQLFPVIPLDDFVKAGSGVCRHLALLFAYFCDKLQKESSLAHILPPGECFLVRDIIPTRNQQGHHAWNLYISSDKNEVWHIDPTWEVVKNFYVDINLLNRLYSPEVIAREMERYALSLFQ